MYVHKRLLSLLISHHRKVIISLYFGTGEGNSRIARQCSHSNPHSGEGGSFALFQGLFPREDNDFDADRTLTGDSLLKPSIRSTGKPKIKEGFRWPLLLWVIKSCLLSLFDV